MTIQRSPPCKSNLKDSLRPTLSGSIFLAGHQVCQRRCNDAAPLHSLRLPQDQGCEREAGSEPKSAAVYAPSRHDLQGPCKVRLGCPAGRVTYASESIQLRTLPHRVRTLLNLLLYFVFQSRRKHLKSRALRSVRMSRIDRRRLV